LTTLEFKPLAGVRRVPYEEAFLIEDLLTSRMTFLAGEPKAGKSLFAAGMVRALLEGRDEFVGLRVHRQLERVVYGYTDDGADEELRERFVGTEAEANVSIAPMHLTGADGFWEELLENLVEARPGLFVLDTVLGSLSSGEDIATGITAQQVVRRVRPISEAGIPVLLVTHTPKGASEGMTVASSVIGGRALAGGARGVIALRKSSRGRRVQTAINRAREDLDLAVNVTRLRDDSDVPVWTRAVTREATPLRTVDEWDERAAFYRSLLTERGEQLSVAEAAGLLADQFKVTPESARNWLKPQGGITKRLANDDAEIA
jgi:hypothetical protein